MKRRQTTFEWEMSDEVPETLFLDTAPLPPASAPALADADDTGCASVGSSRTRRWLGMSFWSVVLVAAILWILSNQAAEEARVRCRNGRSFNSSRPLTESSDSRKVVGRPSNSTSLTARRRRCGRRNACVNLITCRTEGDQNGDPCTLSGLNFAANRSSPNWWTKDPPCASRVPSTNRMVAGCERRPRPTAGGRRPLSNPPIFAFGFGSVMCGPWRKQWAQSTGSILTCVSRSA